MAMSSDNKKMSDDDEISYEFLFDENFRSFTITITSKKSLELNQLAICLKDFATDVENGDIPLYASDEVAMH